MSQASEQIVLRDAERIVDVLNRMTEIEGGVDKRIEYLLRSLRQLLKRHTRCRLTLFDDLSRRPGPRVLKRYALRGTIGEPMEEDRAELQAAVDHTPAVADLLIPKLLDQIRTPLTLVFSEDMLKTGWFEDVFLPRHLDPMGYCDGLASIWAAAPQRAISISILRREGDAPFDEHDRNLISLMLRAVAPVVDRELFAANAIVAETKLTDRQREVLLLLLSGDSEKEVAYHLSRSVHTVHTHVRQLYEQLGVSSRGELMALFIDQAVVRAGLEVAEG